MKVYLYYLIDPDTINTLCERGTMDTLLNFHSVDPGPILYGLTTSSRIARKFEKCRNMRKFKKVVRKIDDEDEIGDSWAVRITDVSLLFANKKHIVIPLSGNEKWCAENATEVIMDHLDIALSFIDPSIFTDEIQDALMRVGYIDFIESHNSGSEYTGKRRYIDGIQEWSNELGMLMWMFREVMDITGIMEVGEIDNENLEVIRRYKNT